MDLSLLPDANVTVFSPLLSKAEFPIDVTLAGMVIVSRDPAARNAASPMEVSLLPDPNVTVLRALAPLNASGPIFVTLAGIVIEVSLFAPENA